MIFKKHIVTAAAMAFLLAACGGGSDDSGTGSGGITGGSTTTTSNSYFSLTDATLATAHTVQLQKTSTTAAVTGTATLGTDSASYTIATSGVVTVSAPFSIIGTLATSGIQVCKPASTAAGAVGAGGGTAGVKSVHVILPDTATAGTIDDMKGKTFDFYEDCAMDTPTTINADGSATGNDGTQPASVVAGALSASGQVITEDGQSATIFLKAYKVGTKVVVVERGVPAAGNSQTPNNTNGYIAVWVSR